MEKTNDKKTSRASQTREKTSHKKVWSPPSALDAPPAPTGFRHRWIRVESLGFQDTKNVAGRIRSGYELVRADEYPDTDYPIVEDGKYKDHSCEPNSRKRFSTESLDSTIKFRCTPCAYWV